MPRYRATDAEIADVVAFLRSLTSEVRPGLASSAWTARAPKTRLRFLDASGSPIRETAVTLAPAGDDLPAPGERAPVHLVTDGDGVVEFAPFATTHARVVLEGGLRPLGGALIPDTCRSATVRIPVRGLARLAVMIPAGEAVPDAFVAEHPMARLFPDRRTPRTILRRVASTDLADGRSVALYSAPFRTDVPAVSPVKLPRTVWGMDRIQLRLDPEERASLDLTK
jgi:hypothetical protein